MMTSKRENEGAGNHAAEKKARTAAAASGAAAKAQPAAQPDKTAKAQPAPQPDKKSSKFDVLMIPPQQPFRLKMPSQEDIASGRGVSVRTYAGNLHRYIVSKLSMFLYNDEVVQLRHPLYASRCPHIEEGRPAASGAVPGKKPANAAAWRPTSIMEPMDIEHCIVALTESQFYEGAISIWNLDPFLTSAFGIDIDAKDPSWAQFLVLAGHWSSANLASSHCDEAAQRYFFQEPFNRLSWTSDTWKKNALRSRRSAICQPAAAMSCVGPSTRPLTKRWRLEIRGGFGCCGRFPTKFRSGCA